MYSFENYLIHPFLSFLVGLLLFFGVCSLGFLIINNFFLKLIKDDKYFILNSPIVGVNSILLLLTPLAYLELLDFTVFRFFGLALIVILFSTLFITVKHKKYFFFNKSNLKKLNFSQFLVIILILLFFLISISPVTHADSLAYHMLGAVNFLLNGDLLNKILPVETKLVGPGELIIALGLSLGSEQFGGIVQFSCLFTIFYCFKNIKKNELSDLMFLGVITTPVFFLLASSPKPQLLQISNVLLCSLLVYKLFENKIANSNQKKIVLFVIIILSLNILVKFSFIISSLLIFCCLLLVLIKKNKLIYLFIPILISVIILFLPKFIFMNNYFNTDIVSFARSSLPVNLSLYDSISLSLKKISNGDRLMPIWIVFPQSIKVVSDAIGPTFLSFLLFNIYKNNQIKVILFIVFIFIVSVLSFGSATSRFIFDGFIVMQLFLLLGKISNNTISNCFRFYIYIQSLLCIIVLSYFVFSLTPGIISYENREKVLKNNASGYDLMRWVNNHLDKDDVIISSHRSLGLIKNKSYSLVYLNYLDSNKQDYKNFINFLDKQNIKKILVHNPEELGIFKNCLGEKISTVDNINIFTGRNPFNKNNKGSATLYKLKTQKLSFCLNN